MENSLCWCGSGLKYSQCHQPIERKMNILRSLGKKCPNRRLIKNRFQIEGIKEACKVNAEVLDRVSEEICAGISTEEINALVDSFTRSLGGIPAPLNYEGFPKSVCTSVNNVVCHGIPSKKQILKDGDIINVDCTTVFGGYYGDASRMYCIGNVSGKAKKLVEVTKKSVEVAEKHLKPYCHLGDIGFYINSFVKSNGFSVVREIGGHGCGLSMHEEPYVCHVGSLNKGIVLVPGMIFTIEPMVNEGRADITVDRNDGWQIYTADNTLSAQIEHMVLITDEGFEILCK